MAATDDGMQFAMLAPQGAEIPGSSYIRYISRDRTHHARLVGEMQRLRGRVARRENAITASMLDSSGRHLMPGDEKSWHLLRLRGDGKVVGCARVLVHAPNVRYSQLSLASSSVARCAVWSGHVQAAVESELRRAKHRDLTTIEPGGWVVDEELRGTCEGVSIALGAFAWAQILGDCIGFVTATVKHGSAAILRRLGGRHLQVGEQHIPKYFEAAWGCNAELLRFDTNSLNPRFEAALASARCRLLASPVFFAEAPCRPRAHVALNTRIQDIYRPIFAANQIP